MVLSTSILGWIGIIIFILLLCCLKRLLNMNEFGIIHLLMVFMYSMWLPLPLALKELLNGGALTVGTIFGEVYLVMIVITMALQTGYLVHSAKQTDNKAGWEERDKFMMATLAGPFEVLANIFKCIWAIFLAVTFWENGDVVMAGFMSLFSIFIVYFLITLLNLSLVNPIKVISKIKPNPYLFNFETFAFFLILIIYVTQQ